MPLKGKQIRSTLTHMEPLKASHSALANDVPFPQAQAQGTKQSLMTAQAPAIGGRRRQYWTVQVMNNQGEPKEAHLRVNDVRLLPGGEKVLIPFDGSQPRGTEVNSLLGGFLSRLGQNHKHFPISFKKWSKVPDTYKDEVWKTIIKEKLWWDPTHEDAARAYIMKEIGKKWRKSRLGLFRYYYDPTKNREENIKNPPSSIQETEWATFIDYKMKEKTQEILEKNVRNRNKRTMHRTSCSKRLKRRGVEIETIIEVESQETSSEAISPNNSFDQVFGKEHPEGPEQVQDICPCGSSFQQYNASGSTSFNGEDCIAQLGNEIAELKMQLQTQDQRLKIMEVLIAQLFKHHSLPIPAWLATDLDNIEKNIEIESQETSSEAISPNNSFDQVFGKEHPGQVQDMGYQQYNASGATSSNRENSIVPLRNEVKELKMQSQANSRRIKLIEVLIAQLCNHLSLPIPAWLATDLYDILADPSSTPSAQSSSESSTDFP